MLFRKAKCCHLIDFFFEFTVFLSSTFTIWCWGWWQGVQAPRGKKTTKKTSTPRFRRLINTRITQHIERHTIVVIHRKLHSATIYGTVNLCAYEIVQHRFGKSVRDFQISTANYSLRNIFSNLQKNTEVRSLISDFYCGERTKFHEVLDPLVPGNVPLGVGIPIKDMATMMSY